MVDRPVLERLLEELERTVATLRELRAVTLQEMRASAEKAWAVEHGLQIAIQAVLDIGGHVLAGLGASDYEEYAEIPDRLAEHGVLPAAFAASIRPMAGFRNLLVHGYARVDVGRVHETLTTRLDDFETFARYVTRWLDGTGDG